jgi:hypothetical protein
LILVHCLNLLEIEYIQNTKHLKILNKNPVTRQAAEEFFTGASIMGASHNQFEKAINSNPLMQATEPQVNTPPIQPMGMPTDGRDQMQMTTPQTPQDTGQRASTYQALFSSRCVRKQLLLLDHNNLMKGD